MGLIWRSLPVAQNELLLHILQHGPSPAYGTHKILKRSQSTVQTAMTDLNNEGLVSLYCEEKSKKGGKKLIYGLTLPGFCYGFNLIARSETMTYDLIEHLINRWQHLCPDILGNWNLLIEKEQGGCPSPDDIDEKNYDWQKEQLPYQVPNMKVKHWILFIDDICGQITQDHLCSHEYRSGSLEELPTPEEMFIKRVSARACEYALCGIDGRADLGCPWNADYLLCVFQRIPALWNQIRQDLNRWRDMHEQSMLRIQQVLDKYDPSP
jgi:predicted transcriptional regulator